MTVASPKLVLLSIVLALGLLVPAGVGATGGSTAAGPTVQSAQLDWSGSSTLTAKKGKPGKGEHGKGKGKKDKAEKKRGPKGNHGKGKGRKDKHGNPNVAPIASNAVSVSCAADGAGVDTVCTFVATGPKGPSKIKVLYVPEAVACSAVIDTSGSGATIDGTPAFASRKNKPDLTITLAGSVSVGGSATYWVEAGKQLVPVAGPGLICEQATPVPATATPSLQTPSTNAEPTQAASPSPSPDPTVATGTIEIRALACSAPMTDPKPDWFRSCPDAADGLQFRLMPVDSGASGLTAITGDDGTVTFDNLAPGTYKLNLVDVDWCHAESNSVDANGNLVVDGETAVTVWVFTCQQ
jgi:hypothetical protein